MKEIKTVNNLLDALGWCKVANSVNSLGMVFAEYSGVGGVPLLRITITNTEDLVAIEWKDDSLNTSIVLGWDKESDLLCKNTDSALLERGRLEQFVTQIKIVLESGKPEFFPGLKSKVCLKMK